MPAGDGSDERGRFVADAVAFQLGAGAQIGWTHSATALGPALAAASGGRLLWHHAQGAPDPSNGWTILPGNGPTHTRLSNAAHVKPRKAIAALGGLIDAELDFDVLIDMQDRRARRSAPAEGPAWPVIAFNRINGDPARILWPLDGHHDLGAEAFLGQIDPGAVPWEEKLPRVAWRGILSGRANPKGDVLRERERAAALVRRLADGESGALTRLGTVPRFRFVTHHIDDTRFDVGLVDGGGVALGAVPALAALARPPIARPAFQRFRYIAVLRGVDVGSSFYWTMNSGSLALVMDCPFETFGSGHFRPWEHYVPFREDLSDLEERLDWCKRNDAACRDMAHNAASVCRFLADGDLRARIARGVVSGLRAALNREDGRA